MADDQPKGRTLEAERDISYVRLAVILFNVAVYWPLLRGQGIPWLAVTVSIVAVTYAFYVVLAKPYLRWPILTAAMFTAFTDSILITVWIFATGGFDSPFHLLWFLSLLAVSFRYDYHATMLATGLYIVCYVGLLGAMGHLIPHAADVLVRCVYIALAGALGVLMAQESSRAYATRDQAVHEVEVERREQQAREVVRLRELDRFKTEFLNAAAHELNTPLTPMQLQLHILNKAEETDNAGARKRAIAIVGRNVERMALLVQDMLDVARLQSGRLAIDRQPADLAAVVRDAIETYRPPAEAKQIRIDVVGPESLVVAIDPKRASQVVYNLVSNAIKYTPRDGVVTVRFGGDADRVHVEVEDNGLGFSQDQLERMFVPFGQVHTHQVSAPGTGLGLFISRGIAEMHGGSLHASSPGPGLGAKFVVELSQTSALPPGGTEEPAQAHGPIWRGS
ncbi:MAG TPA: HAMP domain-containing sensor histidine kinase [Candidatus Thermoplasmatota archaeon]|nr:HAMP domain-containing sensor histidine kinase [Candidatus Thermoplasmatota archaeon]